MKILTRYTILSYIGPFLLTFFIAVFVLFMQYLWKYVDDLIGKGLETSVLIELFFYAALATFPLALPLAILLSSLMTFGNMGEHYELVALKSAGLSLQKIMFPLILLTGLTGAGAFVFSNNMLPYINLRSGSLMYDIQQKKPTLNIKDGVFYNGIDGYTIRIAKKENDTQICRDIIIYDHTAGLGNTKVITAETGSMKITDNKHFLLLTLFNGTSYEEMIQSKSNSYFPLMRSKFKEQTVCFDLSDFRLSRTNKEMFKTNYQMLNISQIDNMIDSLHQESLRQKTEFEKKFSEMLSESMFNPLTTEKRVFSSTSKKIISSPINNARVLEMALNIVRNKKYYIENSLSNMSIYDSPVVSLNIEWHKKFMLSFACFVLFFIGAPLGAIIRKGGLGMPVVVSVIIFILFWVITIIGEKMVKEGVLPAFIGMWISTMITLPLGIFLTIKATLDSSLFNIDAYFKPFQKLIKWIK
ncbi:MAG: LptF/LptG family permease [Bacteroidota bacterium]